MPTILKLSPGTKAVMTVKSADEVEGNYGPQIKFAGSTPDDPDAVVFMNVDPAMRQLERIGFSFTSVVGQTVEFEKTPPKADGKSFTNINRANGVPSHPLQSSKPNTHAKQGFSSGGPLPGEVEAGFSDGSDKLPTEKLAAIFRVYDKCWDHAFKVAHEKMGADCTHEGIAAQAATIFIQAAQRGALV